MNSFTTPTLPLLPPSRFKRWLAALSAVLLTALGATAIAPAAQAAPSEVTATVFDTPDVRYVNVRNGAGTEYTKIGQVNAGASVTLECYSYGSQVQGPYGATNLWYKLKGYDNGWVNDGYIYTGSDEPVTGKCEAAAPTSTEQPYPVTGRTAHVNPEVPMWKQLLNYYYNNKDGGAVVIDWAFFGQPGSHFVKWLYDQNIPIDSNPSLTKGSSTSRGYEATIANDGDDMFFSLAKFDVWRTSENCFAIHDTYDFDLRYPSLMFDAATGAAHVYEIYASGCYPPGSGNVR